jgi:hypothetical protein
MRPLALVASVSLSAACWPGLPRDALGFACRTAADCSAGQQCVGSVCSAELADAGSLSPPLRVAFHRLFYPEAWKRGATANTVDVPSAGLYSSVDEAIIAQQISALEYAQVRAGIVFWDGPDAGDDARFAALLSASVARSMRWAAYYEPEQSGDPTPDAVAEVLGGLVRGYGARANYLRIAGRPVVFVRFGAADGCAAAARWVDANDAGAYLVLKVFSGYESCARQPDGWHQYAPTSASGRHGTFSAFVSPGYQLAGAAPQLARDVSRFRDDVRTMTASGATFQCVESFNDFVDGSAVEASASWASDSGYGAYLDVLHDN